MMSSKYFILLCLALFGAVVFAGRYESKCEYSYDAVPRSGAGGSWTACTGPENNRQCSFYQIYDVVIKNSAKGETIKGCDFAFRPTNGKITDSWGINYGEITFYNPLEAGQTQNLAGFIVRADKQNERINIVRTDRYPCECKDDY